MADYSDFEPVHDYSAFEPVGGTATADPLQQQSVSQFQHALSAVQKSSPIAIKVAMARFLEAKYPETYGAAAEENEQLKLSDTGEFPTLGTMSKSAQYESDELGNDLWKRQFVHLPRVPENYDDPALQQILGTTAQNVNGSERAVEGMATPENAAIGAAVAGLSLTPAAPLVPYIGYGFGAQMLHGGLNRAMSGEPGAVGEGLTQAALGVLPFFHDGRLSALDRAKIADGLKAPPPADSGVVPPSAPVAPVAAPPEESAPPPEQTFPASPGFVQPKARSDYEKMVNVKVAALDDAWKKDNGYIPPAGGGAEIPGRVDAFKAWREANPDTPIESPSVNVDENGQAAFNDGRHRFSVFRDEGLKTMPVTMDESSIANAREAGLLDEEPDAGGKPAGEPPKAATSAPEEPEDDGKTGISNARMKALMDRAGLEAEGAPEAQSFPQWTREANHEMQVDPSRLPNLLSELRENPRAVTGPEQAMLASEVGDRQDSYDKAAKDFKDDPTDENRASLDAATGQLTDIDSILRRAGSESGRSLVGRKITLNRDYSPARIINDFKEQGQTIEPEESEALSQNIKAKEAADEQANVQQNDKVRNSAAKGTLSQLLKEKADDLQSEHDYQIEDGVPYDRLTGLRKVISETRAKAAESLKEEGAAPAPKAVEKSPTGQSQSPPAEAPKTTGIRAAIKAAANEARARDAERSAPGAPQRLTSGIDAETFKDFILIGADHLIDLGAATLKNVKEWKNRMLAELGAKVAPHLDQILKASKAKLREMQQDPAAVRGDMLTKMKARLADGDTDISDLHAYARKLAGAHVRAGIDKVDPLTDAVHADLKTIKPDITREQARDLYSGYGRPKTMDQSAAAVMQRDLNRQAQEQAKLQGMMKTPPEPPKLTGLRRDVPSKELSDAIKRTNEAKKKYNIKTTDPATQLRSATQAIERGLDNRIRDLKEEIDLGPKNPREPTPTTAEIEAKRAQVKDLTKTRDELRATRGNDSHVDLARRHQAALDALDKSEAILKDQIAKKDFAVKSGDRLASPELAARRAEVDAIKSQRDELKALQDQASGKTAADRAAAVQKQIDAIDAKLKSGNIAPKPSAPETDVRVEGLKSERDALSRELQRQRQALKPGKPPGYAEGKKIEAVQKQIAELDRRISTGDIGKRAATAKPMSQAREDLVSERQAMAKQLAELRKEGARGGKTADQIKNENALRAWKTRIDRSTADLKTRTANQNFAPKVRQRLIPDADVMKSKAESAQAKLDYARLVEKARVAGRGWPEKALDLAVALRRASVLSSPATFAKLGASAAQLMAMRPIEEAMGGIVGKLPIIRDIAAKAPLEGGFSLATEKARFSQIGKLKGDAKTILNTGHMDIDAAFGKPDVTTRGLLDKIGEAHAISKSPLKRSAFEAAKVKLGEFYDRQGEDINSTPTQAKINAGAYADANRSVFQERDSLAEPLIRMMRAEGIDRPLAGGKLNAPAKFWAGVMRIMFPVVRIGMNIGARVADYSFGSVVGGGRAVLARMAENQSAIGSLARQLQDPISKLGPEDADAIMRSIKRGNVGVTLLGIGAAMYAYNKSVGGFDEPGKWKRPSGQIKSGSVKVGQVEIPKILMHTPQGEMIQMGGTLARLGLGPGAIASAVGVLDQLPFMGTAQTIVKAGTEKGGVGKVMQGMAGSIIPEGVAWAARKQDTKFNGNFWDYMNADAKQRKIRDVNEAMEARLPWLRQRLPAK